MSFNPNLITESKYYKYKNDSLTKYNTQEENVWSLFSS